MYQDLTAEHIAKFSPDFFAPVYVAAAVPGFRNSDAVGAYDNRFVARITPTPVANDWFTLGLMVSDPEQRGWMVLSYEIFMSTTAGLLQSFVIGIDRQGIGPSAAGAVYPFAATTDIAWDLPIAQRLGATQISATGRYLVDTSITSATPSIDTREFGIGVAMKFPAGVTEVDFSAQLRLYASGAAFFQPSK